MVYTYRYLGITASTFGSQEIPRSTNPVPPTQSGMLENRILFSGGIIENKTKKTPQITSIVWVS